MRNATRKIVAAALTAAGLSLGAGGTAWSAPAPAAGSGGVTTMTVSTSVLPAATRATLDRAGVKAADVLVTNIANGQSGRCLDAPTQRLGVNGNKIQLWDCLGGDLNAHGNQFWIPVFTTQGYTEVVNFASGLCLDADNSHGFVNGARVQEWACFDDSVNHPNQWWNYGPAGARSILPNLWGGGSKLLDAATQSITRNGTLVQIWQGTGALNQTWWQ
jgi:non-reducing end alpha-L-arabinofuranosidase